MFLTKSGLVNRKWLANNDYEIVESIFHYLCLILSATFMSHVLCNQLQTNKNSEEEEIEEESKRKM